MTQDPEHRARVDAMADALIARAQRAQYPDNTYKPPKRTIYPYSSLHEVIRTKAQADKFMAALERLRSK
jgi:hypothetical protein